MINRIITKFKRDGLVSIVIAAAKYAFNSKKRKTFKAMLEKESIADKFSEIYKYNLWSSSESLSGVGSEIEYTKPLRIWLTKNIPTLNVKSFVDAPCGDFNWMKLVLPYLDVSYLGLDIVEGVIKKNKSLYSSERINFNVMDICEDKIPDCDLLMVRDCLFHLSYEDSERFLKNLKDTKYKYLLTTTHCVEDGFRNTNIVTGDWRLINLFSEPFNFNEKVIKDRVIDSPDGYPITREMILVHKKDVPTNLSSV